MKSSTGQVRPPRYVLVTPAKNEERSIALTLDSVVAQSALPSRWVIVSDASTDRTDEIVNQYASRHSFISLLRLDRENRAYSFGSRTNAAIAGYEHLKEVVFDFAGFLDADISFDASYYSDLLGKFERNPRLGLASGRYTENTPRGYELVSIPSSHVPGALQFFRRECYEDIGGYIPLPYGGDDSVAEVTARLKGWETISFPDIMACHHRPAGSGGGISALYSKYRHGLSEYDRGTHPLFMLIRSIGKSYHRPFLLSGMAALAGFFAPYLRNAKRPVPDDVVRQARMEQIRRIFPFLRPKEPDLADGKGVS